MPRPELLIFDFDGVVADSETVANAVLADALTAIGLPTTLDHSLARYMGRRWSDCEALITTDLGRPLPEGFVAECRETMAARHAAELKAVEGIGAFLDAHDDLPRCIASSSSLDWLARALAQLGLSDRFCDRLFSGLQVENGKPAPDVFLLAARTMGAAPARTVVIEDSAPGVQAGVAAGMTVIGLCAGSHIRLGHAERLAEAGAHHMAHSYAQVAELIAEL